MTSFHRRPQFEAPIYKLPTARAAERENDQMPTENLSELLGRVSNNSTGQIDNLVGDFQQLREKLRTDAERIHTGAHAASYASSMCDTPQARHSKI